MTTLTVSISQATEMTSLHRATLYRALAAGRLKSKRVGGRRLIDAQSLREFVGVSDAA